MSTEGAHLANPDLTYSRNELPAYRIPTPPRIVIPPPSLNSSQTSVDLGNVRSTGDPRTDVSFLNFLNLPNITNAQSMVDWKYEKRRHAQRILPFLYLGPIKAAKDVAFLQQEGITMILAVRHRSSLQLLGGALRVAEQQGIANEVIDIADNMELIAAFPGVNQVINQHLVCVRNRALAAAPKLPPEQTMGKVLIFCESGNDRSAAACAAYLMEMIEGMDYVSAMRFAQTQRFCVNFDDAMKYVLSTYWDLITAKRMVRDVGSQSSAQGQHQGGLATRGKRTVDSAFDDEMDVETEQGREFTPFTDAKC